jgi:hypothetical protein
VFGGVVEVEVLLLGIHLNLKIRKQLSCDRDSRQTPLANIEFRIHTTLTIIIIMAASIPAPLKTPDITPFVTRGAQLEKARPVIAYWCKLLGAIIRDTC